MRPALVFLASLILAACSAPFWGARFSPTGLTDRVVLSLVVGADGALYAGTNDGIYRSPDAGRSWQAIEGLPAQTTVPGLHRGPTSLMAATSRGVYMSVDGLRWQMTGVGLPTDLLVLSVVADPADGQVVVIGTSRHGIFRSQDGGQSWQASATGLPSDSPVYMLAYDPGQSKRLLAGTIGTGLFRSDDGGRQWRPASQGLAPRTNVFCLVGGQGWLIVGTSAGVARSSDGGETWRWSRSVLGHTRVVALALDPADPRRVVAGADDGVYQSADAGLSWQRLAEGIPPEEHVGAIAVVGRRIIAGAGPAWVVERH